MKKTIGISILFVLFVFGAIAQPTTAGGAYTESQARQARENAEMNRHYESMKPSKKASSNSNVSGDYNSKGWGQGIGSERVAAGERNDALQKEWNDKINKLLNLIVQKNIGKTSSDYYAFMEAAKESFTGYNSDYTISTLFPQTASEYELKANDKTSSFYKKWFLEADKIKPATKTITKPVYSSGVVVHNTQYGSGNLKHPLFFENVTTAQINEGYKQFNAIDAYILSILADGKNNYNNSIDQNTRYTNSECGCDAVYGLKYYYKTYGAMEYGIFKGPGWDYPFLRMYLKTKTSEEVDETFNDFVNKIAAIEKFTRYRSEYTDDNKAAYFDIDNNEGFKYTVWIEKGYKSYGLRMGIDKKQSSVSSSKASFNFSDLLNAKTQQPFSSQTNKTTAQNSNPVLESLKIKEASSSAPKQTSTIYNSLKIVSESNAELNTFLQKFVNVVADCENDFSSIITQPNHKYQKDAEQYFNSSIIFTDGAYTEISKIEKGGRIIFSYYGSFRMGSAMNFSTVTSSIKKHYAKKIKVIKISADKQTEQYLINNTVYIMLAKQQSSAGITVYINKEGGPAADKFQ